MPNKNSILQAAKKTKYDEFYTTYETVGNELSHYGKHFKGKSVLCNCDDPFGSSFCQYFLRNFNLLGLKRLICTSYATSRQAAGMKGMTDADGRHYVEGHGLVLDTGKFSNADGIIPDEEIVRHMGIPGIVKVLKGDGDFRSYECMEYLEQSDIVVTNPPFSLFKELVVEIIRHKKKFLLIGNQNALTYKEIFPLLLNNEAWTGYQFGEMKFRVPADSEPRDTRYWVDGEGQKWRSLGNAMWLTNLDIERRYAILPCTHTYNTGDYPRYDSFNAINVRKITEIPYDYEGIMGVPVTFINRHNNEQFEIIGEANHGSDSEYDLFKPTINGKLLFKRILIRNRKPGMPMLSLTNLAENFTDEEISLFTGTGKLCHGNPEGTGEPTGEKLEKGPEFRILDLFSGAGGLSYGMEKNPHFKTTVALDHSPQALETFRHNMPDAETIDGDITDPSVKKDVIRLCREKGVNMIIGGPPCQGFSMKGKKLGLDDPRNYLFNEYLSFVSELQPEVFVIENVKALLSTSAGWFKDQIISKVTGMGYRVNYGVLNASGFGVPQNRQRAIFICSKDREIPLPEPSSDSVVTVRDAISDLAYLESGEGSFKQEYRTEPESDYQRKMRGNCHTLYNHKASNHAPVAIRKLSLIPPECGKECLPPEMLGNQQFSGTWGRLKWDAPSPTIDTRFDAASNGTNNHPFLNRAITPREAARLQSFDDSFVFIGQKFYIRQQIGNAVPPLLAEAIADRIYTAYHTKEKEKQG